MKSNGMATLIVILSCGGIGDSNGGSGGVGVGLFEDDNSIRSDTSYHALMQEGLCTLD